MPQLVCKTNVSAHPHTEFLRTYMVQEATTLTAFRALLNEHTLKTVWLNAWYSHSRDHDKVRTKSLWCGNRCPFMLIGTGHHLLLIYTWPFHSLKHNFHLNLTWPGWNYHSIQRTPRAASISLDFFFCSHCAVYINLRWLKAIPSQSSESFWITNCCSFQNRRNILAMYHISVLQNQALEGI